MEKYNQVYLALWLFFSALTFAFMMVFVLNNLAGIIEVDERIENEGLALSFLLLFLASEAIGLILATSTIDRMPQTNMQSLVSANSQILHGLEFNKDFTEPKPTILLRTSSAY